MNNKFNIKDGRLPNLGTILMVENTIKKQKTTTIPKIKNSLKKQVMHQTLKIILSYLWESKKIEYTPEGIKWMFKER
jgi:hypothetical protein